MIPQRKAGSGLLWQILLFIETIRLRSVERSGPERSLMKEKLRDQYLIICGNVSWPGSNRVLRSD